MILDWIIGLATSILQGFFSILPNLTIPTWMTSGTFGSGVATAIGGALAGVRSFVPVDTFLTVISSVLSLWPVIVGYIIFEWVWKHIPTVAGFGTGDG